MLRKFLAIVCAIIIAIIFCAVFLSSDCKADAVSKPNTTTVSTTNVVSTTKNNKAKTQKKKTKTTKSKNNAKAKTKKENKINQKDLEYLTVVIYCEAGSDYIADSTRIMVGNVVMNRVKSKRFPNTIKAVLMQRGQYGSFSRTGIVLPSRAKREQHAVERARKCALQVLNGRNLLPSNVVYQSNFSYLGSGIHCKQDGLYFNYL